ncbi:MAG: AMIN domain-containing protein [Thermodesulfobacteriota bacterium]|nr:AMIN domain-containing protein [Thermodesulfobacteriota bacterium]
MFKSITAASALVLFILLHAWLAVAADQKLLEEITFETSSGNEERVTFKLNSVNIPTIFAMKGEKPRVVFDFPDTKPFRLLKNTINTNGKFIKRIRMGIHYEPKPKTRIVFDLLPNKEVEFKHDFDTEKNALIISVYHAGAEPDSRPDVAGEEKKDIVPEDLEQAEKAVQAQKPEITETLPEPELKIPEQEETSAITSPPSEPVQTVAQPSEEEAAPAPLEPEPQQPEPKLSDTQPEEQQEEKHAPATEPETAVTSPAPEVPTVEQEKTAAIPLPPSEPVQTVAQPSGEEIAVPQEPEPELSDTQPDAQQEEEQTPIPAEEPETDKSSVPPILSSVTFDNSTNRGEMVLFKLNDFHPPIVFGVEEGLPRVVCDFKGAVAAEDVPNVIKTDGKYVHTIRIGKEKTPKKVRVVLDLNSSINYDLQQVFFKDDNLFVIIINSLGNTPTREELEKPLK